MVSVGPAFADAKGYMVPNCFRPATLVLIALLASCLFVVSFDLHYNSCAGTVTKSCGHFNYPRSVLATLLPLAAGKENSGSVFYEEALSNDAIVRDKAARGDEVTGTSQIIGNESGANRVEFEENARGRDGAMVPERMVAKAHLLPENMLTKVVDKNGSDELQRQPMPVNSASLPDGNPVDANYTSQGSAQASEKETSLVYGSTMQRQCFLYDRPPRTGSTTISDALTACMRKHGYLLAVAPTVQERRLLVKRLFDLDGDRVSATRSHMSMTSAEVHELKRHCQKLFVVTSARTMSARLLSAVKYSFHADHGNSSLTKEQVEEVYRVLEAPHWQEQFLEEYPYVDEDKVPLGIREEERLIPDYVIRADRMEEDLGKLLGAMHCEGHFLSQNVHEGGAQMELQNRVQLVYGDFRYRQLSRLAANGNAAGLEKVASLSDWGQA